MNHPKLEGIEQAVVEIYFNKMIKRLSRDKTPAQANEAIIQYMTRLITVPVSEVIDIAQNGVALEVETRDNYCMFECRHNPIALRGTL